jgi:hypothetical protein
MTNYENIIEVSYTFQSPNYVYTPLNISHVRNGTTKGCPTRDLRATVTDKSVK